MKKPTILGLLLVGLVAYSATRCASSSGTDAGAPATAAKNCSPATVGPLSDDGGLTRVASSDPGMSIALDDGGHYPMPGGTYKGYCFTFADKAGSTFYPPCGDVGPCFTKATGLCVSANLGAGSATTWGGGIGCNIDQAAGAGTTALYTDVKGKTSITVAATGCKIPDQLQVQLNVANPPTSAAGVPGSGYFCKLATLGAPDANGVRSATVNLTELTQDCWLTGGTAMDPATMYATSIQVQINSIEGVPSTWDFCISQLAIQ